MKKHVFPHLAAFAMATAVLCGTFAGSAFAQSAPAVNPAPAGVVPVQACQAVAYTNQGVIYLVTSSGARCQPGAPLSFKLYRFNDFVAEQACNFGKTVSRIAAEDAVDERVMCAHSGTILEPDRRAGSGGLVLRYGYRVNGTMAPLPGQ